MKSGMNNVIKKVLLSVAFFAVLFFSHGYQVLAQNSYELFWPIVAGRTSGDSLYPLKLLKENIRAVLIFSDIKKAEYSLFLSEKRLVEFENLVKVKKDGGNAIKTLDALNKNHMKVIDYLGKAKGGDVGVGYTKQRILNSFGNQVLVLESMLGSLESNLKDPVFATIAFLKSETEKLH